ncbi:MAG: family 2 glycosyl [Prolixibacteraceae bacterium]|nr:MAG: family 2 glycosyl [Prolixibacteraceae bacterium]
MNNKKIFNSLTAIEKATVRLMILLGLITIFNFFYWFLNPVFIDNHLLYWLLIGPIVFDSIRIIYIWYHYWDISMPKKPVLTKKITADVLTTFFPGEPYEMITGTLLAVQKIKYPHTTYLCDEANDPYLKDFCKLHGIIHVTRNNRINAKAGNINNALLQANGDICLILDPDHVPKPDFLDEVIPYFEDEKIGFVQTVQAYYNIEESSVAKGAAEQTFHFYGPIMMTMNSYGTVNAIGANCVFRRKALDSIGGHAPGLSEDMHTAMQLFAKGWKSVYVPQIFTKGLVPSTLTSYYKQQLKWSRGTLELLVTVFPKLFRHFTWRQRIHFGILPLHYLSGIFYLISFLIPFISLFTATTPWKGNVINFGLIFLPVLTSILGIRFYVQRWVTDKSERGTHLMGGVLLACTWWIYIIGLIYTIIRKKVPYLPTPKEDKDRTSWKILIPNLIVGVVSIIAVIYGLSIDFTPFSIFMSGFALLNASFMFYTLKFAYQKPKPVSLSFDIKEKGNLIISSIQNHAFKFWHKAALPFVFVLLATFGSFHYYTEYVKWGGVKPEIQKKNVINYIGVFAPIADNGISNLQNVRDLSEQIDVSFDIISLYVAWKKDIESNFPAVLLDSIYRQKSIPMITWEPWLNSFNDETNQDKHVFELIEDGYFDSFITHFAEKLKNLNRPVFLRFAHEFDNPFYPWYIAGDSASVKFKKAWVHTYGIFKNIEANNVIWVWNPWKSENVASFYPGREYLDWIGVNILNYGNLNEDGGWQDFDSLYHHFHMEFVNLPSTPVMISEFGSLPDEGNQNEWITNAFASIENEYDEIKSVIYFNSKVDNNWPNGLQQNGFLDWTITQNQLIKNSFNNKEVPDYVFSELPEIFPSQAPEYQNITKEFKDIKGIYFQKGHDWRKDYHVLNRQNLETEFEKIKRLGINTLKFEGNSIYRYNVLTIAKEYDIDIAYGFWIPSYLDFIIDTIQARQLKSDILKILNRHKNNEQITSWNIQNDVQYNQKDFYLKPRLLYQNRAYLIWLQDLVREIKNIDSIRPVIVDLEVNQLSVYHAGMMIDNVNGIDGLGLVLKDEQQLDSLSAYLYRKKIKYIYSEIDVEPLIKQEIFDKHPSFFITSWRDLHESNRLTFNGITDRKGRYKTEYLKLMNSLQDTGTQIDNSKIRILKPTIPMYSNNIHEYYAMIYNENTDWKYGMQVDGYSFEWSLVKCDKYGNYLAIKDVGIGPVLSLKIPENHEFFRLLLTASDGKAIKTDITTLNTPYIMND